MGGGYGRSDIPNLSSERSFRGRKSSPFVEEFLDTDNLSAIVDEKVEDEDETDLYEDLDDLGIHVDEFDDDCVTVLAFGDDAEDDARVEQLEKDHAALKNEHRGLQDEIKNMTEQLAWIESQLVATKGHAKCLSKSTSDWAGMMKQIHRANTVQEQRRVIRQGTMVVKHSTRKRGCGSRFLAFDSVSGCLLWSKTITGAGEICRLVSSGAGFSLVGAGGSSHNLHATAAVSKKASHKALTRRRSSFVSGFGSAASMTVDEPSNLNSGGRLGPNTSALPLGEVVAVLHGAADLEALHLKHGHSADLARGARPDFVVAFLTSQVGAAPLVFEFFDAEVAESFALGIRSQLYTTPTAPAVAEPHTDAADDRHEPAGLAARGHPMGPMLAVDRTRCNSNISSSSSSSAASTPTALPSAPPVAGDIIRAGRRVGPVRSASAARLTKADVASRILFGADNLSCGSANSASSFGTAVTTAAAAAASAAAGSALGGMGGVAGIPGGSCGLPDGRENASMSDLASICSVRSKASVRSLNTSFELKSLEPSGASHSYRISQLQRDLMPVRSRQAYLDVLIGSADRSELVLPLASSQEHRNVSADHTQVIKDLSREKAILLNAKEFELGSIENARQLIRELTRLLADTMRHCLATGFAKSQDGGQPPSVGSDEAERAAAACDDGGVPTDEDSDRVANPVDIDCAAEEWAREVLLAASRTVIEGDVYAICHRILTGPPEVLLCPSLDAGKAETIEIFVAPHGLVTIESETHYRVVHMLDDQGIASPEEWAKVHARCIEHISLAPRLVADVDERNIRSVRLEFEP